MHVYRREITRDEQTSLSVLAGLIHPGATVLDLGTGSGALGKYLSEALGCRVDGLTFNAAEAALAAPAYRRLEVANLETCVLQELFGAAQYDFIVCADVLEHLGRPERVVQACRDLLTHDGKLLVSVPNAAYCGLIGELIQGEFRYRDEGLLDRTHLRFFTRRSLTRFLAELGWSLERIESIRRELPESEFGLAFDSLAPAMSRHLLALPDALSYQFIAVAQPKPASSTAMLDAAAEGDEPAQALFSAQLYFGSDGVFQEHSKLLARGVIGQMKQSLCFTLPAGPFNQLRLDPADRPGFVHLHQMTLRDAQGEICWQWHSQTDGLRSLEAMPHQQILMHALWPASDASLLLLHGDDPWLQLPIAPDCLAASTHAAGAILEVQLGWPMSADYLALASAFQPLALQLEAQARNAAGLRDQLGQSSAAFSHQLARSTADLSNQLARSESLILASGEENRRLFEAELARKMQQIQALNDANGLLQASRDGLQAHLQWIENSTIFRLTRPLVKFKMWISGQGKNPSSTPGAASPSVLTPVPAPNPGHPVDIIVPVYRGLDDTRCCIEAVLAHANANHTPMRLIVINDASPEPELSAWLRAKAAEEQLLTLLENSDNLGFVGSVNRGMALSQLHDVVLLNSDAEVANNWLDRLSSAAWSDQKVASVTPFSNNATICSYPQFCQDNALPEGYDTASLDALFAQSNPGQVVDVPTGVGFCMYIRRDALEQIGLFDGKSFGKGYGEENDFCQRAAKAGWRNLHLLDTFVRHAGGVSFLDSKSPREQAAMQTLRRLHPGYEAEVQQFIQADPAHNARRMVDLARLRASGKPVILAVLHDRAGGTLRHATELAAHLSSQAIFFTLTPAAGAQVVLQHIEPATGQPRPGPLTFHVSEEWDALLLVLRHLGLRHIHFHHLIGHSPQVLRLPQELGLQYDFTAHDFYTLCPQISLTDSNNRYCGEQGVAQCRSCLRIAPAPGGVSIEDWRAQYGALVNQARYVLTPSDDTARRFARYLPQANIRYAPHTDLAHDAKLPQPSPAPLAPQRPLKIVLLGALSPIKGADVLQDAAAEAARSGALLEFHLLGFAYRDLRTQPAHYLTVHGEYAEADLPDLLAKLQPDLAWFPAQWPETYSYTLSACLQAGLPVVAPELGAFAERLQGRAWSWLQPWSQSSAAWVNFFLGLREHHFSTGIAPTQLPSVESASRHWSYQHDYLAELPAAPVLADGALNALNAVIHQQRPAATLSWRQRKKQKILLRLVHLRASRGLRGLARAIPLRWQTRIKSWLRA